MKLLLALILLPLGYLVRTATAPDRTTEEYTYEVTVESSTPKSEQFNIIVTGVTLTDNGNQEPYKLERKKLKTPYQLHLKNGKYTVKVTSKANNGAIISKVQGMVQGEKMGSASGDSGSTILQFGFGGYFSARDE